MSREQDFITEARQAARDLWNALNKLEALQKEYNALDYGNTLEAGTNENAGLTKTEIGAVAFDTANAFVTLLGAGHATNIAKVL
jgi:hypothetical protein